MWRVRSCLAVQVLIRHLEQLKKRKVHSRVNVESAEVLMNSVDGLEAHHCLTGSIECFGVVRLLFRFGVHGDSLQQRSKSNKEKGTYIGACTECT